MTKSEYEALAEDLVATFEACGSRMWSEKAALLALDDLAPHSLADVKEALARCRAEVRGNLALAHILRRIPTRGRA